jgi:hypothetical protein
MLHKLGRFLQLFAMLLLPSAIAGELAGKFNSKVELSLLGVGILIFVVGWLIQQRGRAP